jgi:hypothetical protein
MASSSSSSAQETSLGGAAAIAATPAAKLFFARVSDASRHLLSQRKPWLELVDRSSFARPDSISEATSRIRKNAAYFRVNYLIVLTVMVAFTLVSHPVSFFFLASLLGAWAYMYLIRSGPFAAFGRTFSERELFVLMSILSIVVIFLTNVGSVLISATVIGAVIIGVHAAFRVPDDLFLDDDGSSAGFFIPFIGSIPVQPPVNTV